LGSNAKSKFADRKFFADAESENKNIIIIKGISYEAYIIKEILLSKKRRKIKVIILLPGTKVKKLLLLKRIL